MPKKPKQSKNIIAMLRRRIGLAHTQAEQKELQRRLTEIRRQLKLAKQRQKAA